MRFAECRFCVIRALDFATGHEEEIGDLERIVKCNGESILRRHLQGGQLETRHVIMARS